MKNVPPALQAQGVRGILKTQLFYAPAFYGNLAQIKRTLTHHEEADALDLILRWSVGFASRAGR